MGNGLEHLLCKHDDLHKMLAMAAVSLIPALRVREGGS